MNQKWCFSILCNDLWMEFSGFDSIIGATETLSLWLSDDVRDHNDYLEIINKILIGELKNELLWGNGYKAYVDRDYTEIHFNFEDEDSSVKPCKLPTKLLREIVEVWLEEYEKFRNSKK